MEGLSALAAGGVWPAVPLTGYLVFAATEGASPFPAVTAGALIVVAGLAAWSVPLLGTAAVGAYQPQILGVVGWAVTVAGLVVVVRRGSFSYAVAAVRESVVWDWLLMAGLIVAAALYLGFPTESIYGGRDEGVYANLAVYLTHHGRLDVPYPWPEDATSIFAHAWLGFPGLYNTPGHMTVQFGHLFPVWLAQAFATLGAPGLFRLNALLATLSLAVFYGVCRMAVGPPYAVVATLFLAYNPSELWTARITLSESFARLFTWSGLLLLLQALRSQQRPTARWAGIFFALAALVRFDGLVLVPLLFLSHVVFKIVVAGDARAPGGVATVGGGGAPDSAAVWAALYQTALPGCALAFGYYALVSAPYFHELAQFYVARLLAACGLSLLILLTSTGGIVQRLRPYLTSKTTLSILGSAVFAVAAYAFWIRPKPSGAPRWHSGWPGFSFDLTYDYSQDSLVNLAQYLSSPVLWIAIAGWVLAAWSLARQRRDPHLVPTVVIIAGCSVLYLWDPSIYPDHFWAIRRFVPVVIPGLIFFATLGVSHALARLPKAWAFAAAAGSVVLLSMFTFNASMLILTFAESRGFFAQLHALAEKLPADELIVTHGHKYWVTPLYVAFGRKVVPIDITTLEGRRAWDAWVTKQTSQHKAAYLLTEVNENTPRSVWDAPFVLSRSISEPTVNPLPRRILIVVSKVQLYKATENTPLYLGPAGDDP